MFNVYMMRLMPSEIEKNWHMDDAFPDLGVRAGGFIVFSDPVSPSTQKNQYILYTSAFKYRLIPITAYKKNNIILPLT